MTFHGPWWTWVLGALAGVAGAFLLGFLLIGWVTNWFWWNRRKPDGPPPDPSCSSEAAMHSDTGGSNLHFDRVTHRQERI